MSTQQPKKKGTAGEQAAAAAEARKMSGRAQRKIAEEEAAKKRRMYFFGSLVALAAIIALVAFFVTRDEEDTREPLVKAPDSVVSASVDGRKIGTAGDKVVEIVEFGDYQCPGCGNFWKTATPMLIQEYVNTGKATFEFKDFAFLGEESQKAAEAAACAEDQGKYWEYHDLVYANQHGENQGYFSDGRLKELAGMVPGMDTATFSTCFDAGTHTADITAMVDEGKGLGVNSTPTIIIDGELVQYQGYDDLKAKIDAAIAKRQ